MGRFVGPDALIGVDYAPRLHEHSPCDGNGPWKERMVVSNGNASADKVAIDTAAGSGMEAVCARELAGQGYAVALMSTSGKVTGSVTEEADLEALVGRTLDRYGRVDGVVNSTGHPPPTLRAGIWLLSTVSVARSGEV